jgi:hypothetical protein
MIHKTFFIPPCFSLAVRNMGLKRMLCSNWFTRLVLVSWMVCAVAILVVFKNMELIVHGQLYYYGLVFSPDWADPYRFFTWMIFLCVGLPMALSGLALVSSFLKVENAPKKEVAIPQKLVAPRVAPRVAAKAESQQVVRPKRIENSNGVNNEGISCPHCNKVFGRALVMLDFHGGKNQLVSVCPYCNHVLGNSTDAKATSEDFSVATQGEKIIH